MDKLLESDAKLFHKIMDSLLFFANKKLNIIKNCSSIQELHKNAIEKTIPIRKKVFSDNKMIDEYLKENPDRLSDEEMQILASWKKSLEGEFMLARYEKEFALFLHSKLQRVYGVKGITDSFKEKFEGYSPIMIKIRLLPFKDNLIYDWIFFPYQITFGSGMRSSMKVEADSAIQKYGIITSLEDPAQEKKTSDEDLLRFYFRSQDTRDRYFEEMEKLRRKSPKLEAVYHQETAGVLARDIKKSLKAQGIKGHFAVLVDAVVASALTEKELEENIKKIVPENRQSWIYMFKL